ncbi:hypothetical protein ACFSRY_19215 [Pontibacter locisalis]|uniref:Uncharacterized protein n=1 Tax=Pontibacter locisalis TaxID=1719035 RepID=A0ABW5IQT2_9BACT
MFSRTALYAGRKTPDSGFDYNLVYNLLPLSSFDFSSDDNSAPNDRDHAIEEVLSVSTY